MAETRHAPANDRDLPRRLREMVSALGDRLPPGDRRLGEEPTDATACGLALETISEALAEDEMLLDRSVVEKLARLAETMGRSTELVARRSPLGVG